MVHLEAGRNYTKWTVKIKVSSKEFVVKLQKFISTSFNIITNLKDHDLSIELATWLLIIRL